MTDEELMKLALEQAHLAIEHEDVPVGAAIVVGEGVVSVAHNRREIDQDPTAHAELIAIREASQNLGSWRLGEATLVVTLEPCVMCVGAAIAARVSRIVYGATDPKAGATGSLYNIAADPRLNHEPAVTSGVLADECGALLTNFFRSKR